jgi:leucyl aminopeptidase (aminopeptidase T)
MALPNNDSIQGQTPEVPKQTQEANKQMMPETSENAMRSTGPQPAAKPASDDKDDQKISTALNNIQSQAPKDTVVQNPAPQTAPKSSSSEPYIKAAESVIEKDKDDPYKEEEDHEDVQVQYLHDRFGKDIKRDK